MKKVSEHIAKENLDEDIRLELIMMALKNQKRIKLSFRGISMEPSVKDGEKVFFEGVSPDQIRVGDIILFNNKGTLIGHRVLWKVKLKQIYFLTKGDNSNLPDRPINAKNVYGRVIHSYNKIVNDRLHFRSKIGFLLEILFSKIGSISLSKLKKFRNNLLSVFYRI